MNKFVWGVELAKVWKPPIAHGPVEFAKLRVQSSFKLLLSRPKFLLRSRCELRPEVTAERLRYCFEGTQLIVCADFKQAGTPVERLS